MDRSFSGSPFGHYWALRAITRSLSEEHWAGSCKNKPPASRAFSEWS
jgi:hypothetical protein